MFRAIVAGGIKSFILRKNEILPAFSTAKTIISIRPGKELHTLNLLTDIAKGVQGHVIFSQSFDSLEICDDAEWHIALPVHVFSQEQIFTEIVNREIILSEISLAP
jgi:hypothetical protein